MWRRGLFETQLTTGCSVAAVVRHSDNPELLARAAEVFTSWRKPFYDALLVDGFDKQRARALATTVIAALEGAVILSRAERCITPLGETAAVLHDLLTVRRATQAKARDDSRATTPKQESLLGSGLGKTAFALPRPSGITASSGETSRPTHRASLPARHL